MNESISAELFCVSKLSENNLTVPLYVNMYVIVQTVLEYVVVLFL